MEATLAKLVESGCPNWILLLPKPCCISDKKYIFKQLQLYASTFSAWMDGGWSIKWELVKIENH